MDRQELSDSVWARIEPHLPGKESDPGRSGRDNRLFVEAILWLARGRGYRGYGGGYGDRCNNPFTPRPNTIIVTHGPNYGASLLNILISSGITVPVY